MCGKQGGAQAAVGFGLAGQARAARRGEQAAELLAQRGRVALVAADARRLAHRAGQVRVESWAVQHHRRVEAVDQGGDLLQRDEHPAAGLHPGQLQVTQTMRPFMRLEHFQLDQRQRLLGVANAQPVPEDPGARHVRRPGPRPGRAALAAVQWW